MNDTIAFWESQIKHNKNERLIEAAFFHIYIKYESIIREIFIKFSTGKSLTNFSPSRRLLFEDENQLFDLIRGEGQFVDYNKAIPRCSKHIFIKNPFDIIYNSSDYAQEIYQMFLIRNYIAHRSLESRERYIRSVLGAYSIEPFEEPGIFLMHNKPKSKISFYSHYINTMQEITGIYSNDTILQQYEEKPVDSSLST